MLTPTGRAHALVRTFIHDRPRRPASEEQCVDGAAKRALLSSDLPVAMKNGYRPRIVRLKFSGDVARARIKFTAFYRLWRFRRSGDNWKIDDFSLPVRE